MAPPPRPKGSPACLCLVMRVLRLGSGLSPVASADAQVAAGASARFRGHADCKMFIFHRFYKGKASFQGKKLLLVFIRDSGMRVQNCYERARKTVNQLICTIQMCNQS